MSARKPADGNPRWCAVCHGDMGNAPAWTVVCTPCFVKAKKQEQVDLAETVDALRAEVEYLHESLTLARAEVRELRSQPPPKPPKPPKPQPQIDAATIRRLLQLCHPDKHGGSKAANEMTHWLLALRKGGRP